MSKNENAMLKLAELTAKEISKRHKISRLNAFLRLMKSKTGEMLFDESTDMWMNGPDYIADEYNREMFFKRYKVPMT